MMPLFSEVLRDGRECISKKTSEFSQKILDLLRYLLQTQVPGKTVNVLCICHLLGQWFSNSRLQQSIRLEWSLKTNVCLVGADAASLRATD